MTVPLKQWQRLADDLEFEQLANARKLAEGWRTGLASITALLAAVTIIKGPDSITQLSVWARYVVVGLLLIAFILLIAGSLTATRAASGNPGEEIFLDGEALRGWTFTEARSIQHAIMRAARLMLIGLGALALGIGLSWLGQRDSSAESLITVQVGAIRTCGTLLAETGRTVVLGDPANPAAAPQVIPLSAGTQIHTTDQC